MIKNPTGPDSGSSRVARGGSVDNYADYCRSALRDWFKPLLRSNRLGFRLSRTGPFRDERQRSVNAQEMVYLPGGRFDMGDNRGDIDERPVHPVRLDAFAIGRTAVTWGEYQRFCEAVDGHWPEWLEPGSQYHLEEGSSDHYRNCGIARDTLDVPVVGISWNDATAYCEWLSDQTGEHYRLPTEAEWEYACRAGTDTRWCFGDDKQLLRDHAWYQANSNGRLHPVAQKAENPWGLYDMHGNVWEWCQDWHWPYDSQKAGGI